MFTSVIQSPIAPLTRNFFNEIERPNNEKDWSLSCLAVALMRPRIENYRGIYGCVGNYLNCDSALSIIANSDTERTQYKNDLINKPAIYYNTLPMKAETLERIKEEMAKFGFAEVKPLEAYVAQELQMQLFAVFTKKEINCAVIFAGTENLALYHLCFAFLPNLFPAVFESKPVTQEEVQILKSLSHRTSTQFVALLGQALSPLKRQLMRTELDMCFRGFRETKIRSAKTIVENCQQKIDNIMLQYRDEVDKLNNAIVIYEGLKVVNADGNNEQEQEAIDYLVDNPRLHNVRYANGQLEFDVDTLLTNFDVMKFKNAVRNKEIYDAYRLPDGNPFTNKASRKTFLDALFNSQTPELAVRIRGHIVLQINRSYMDAPRVNEFDTANPALDNALTNPHFRFHGCPGQNREQISQCLREADIVSAIECSIAATGSVNIGETDITFRPFVQEIMSSSKKIIHRFSDGVEMTPAEALLWLTKKQGETAA